VPDSGDGYVDDKTVRSETYALKRLPTDQRSAAQSLANAVPVHVCVVAMAAKFTRHFFRQGKKDEAA
jgi:hypothetical protein